MQIESVIQKIEALKPVSYLGEKIMEISADPESSLAEMVEVIKYDQSMTANLLRTCNSSLFGLRKEISSV